MHALLSLLTFALAAGSAPKAVEAQPTIQFVYIGATNCGFCKKADFKERAAMIRDGARQWAKEHRFPFETIGVAVDADRSAGDRSRGGSAPMTTVSGAGSGEPIPSLFRTTPERVLQLRGAARCHSASGRLPAGHRRTGTSRGDPSCRDHHQGLRPPRHHHAESGHHLETEALRKGLQTSAGSA